MAATLRHCTTLWHCLYNILWHCATLWHCTTYCGIVQHCGIVEHCGIVQHCGMGVGLMFGGVCPRQGHFACWAPLKDSVSWPFTSLHRSSGTKNLPDWLLTIGDQLKVGRSTERKRFSVFEGHISVPAFMQQFELGTERNQFAM